MNRLLGTFLRTIQKQNKNVFLLQYKSKDYVAYKVQQREESVFENKVKHRKNETRARKRETENEEKQH